MARIGIDLRRCISRVDRRIVGNFIEHLGRCIYGAASSMKARRSAPSADSGVT
jgi:alpha-L-arabinofuranosidase